MSLGLLVGGQRSYRYPACGSRSTGTSIGERGPNSLILAVPRGSLLGEDPIDHAVNGVGPVPFVVAFPVEPELSRQGDRRADRAAASFRGQQGQRLVAGRDVLLLTHNRRLVISQSFFTVLHPAVFAIPPPGSRPSP